MNHLQSSGQREYVIEEADKPLGHALNPAGERTWHVRAHDSTDARVKVALKLGLDATQLKVVAHD